MSEPEAIQPVIRSVPCDRWRSCAKVVRLTGVLAGIFILLPPEHPGRHSANQVLPTLAIGVGILSCLPYSRIRTPLFFWFAVSSYATLLVAFAMVFGLNSFSDFSARALRDLEVLGLIVFIVGFFAVLLAQIPCIVLLRKHQWPNKHLPTSTHDVSVA